MPKVEEYRIAAPFALEELVAAANSLLRARPDILVGRRTVRYYIQEGILPPPTGAPKYARYSYEHLLRLVLIRLLLAQGLRLEAIRARLDEVARGGRSRLEAAVTSILNSEPEQDLAPPGLARDLPGVYRYREVRSPPQSVDWMRQEAPDDDWDAPMLFRRIPLTDRVSLEIAPGGDLETDLEEAAETLERLLKNLRDTS